LATQVWRNSTTQGSCYIPSTIAQPGASTPSCGLPSPG
jgi:hypothetical protein